MRVADTGDLGAVVRDSRASLRLSQMELAEAAGVSRRWIASFEAGKPTVELGLVLKTLDALGLTLHIQTARATDDQVDIDDLLRGLARPHG